MKTSGQYENVDEVTAYARSHEKPDKKYSILPTVLDLLGDVKGKTVLDCGCGDGFFTRAIAQRGAKRVIGVDNSSTQIALAQKIEHPNTVGYEELDIYTAPALPSADVICAPFMTDYAEDVSALKMFFAKAYSALSDGGRLVLVVNVPSDADLKRYGAEKRIANAKDGESMTITLYGERGDVIRILNAMYYTQETDERLLREAGFVEIKWHRPIIDPAGVEKYGAAFWEGYADNPELGYLTAIK